MIKKILVSIIPLAALFMLCSNQMSDNGRAGRTGSPGETTCTGCHSSFALNSGGGSISLQSPGTPAFQYTPGQTYTMSVTVSRTGNSLFGVGIEALTSTNDNAGMLNITDPASTSIKTATVSGIARRNIVHTLNGGASPNSKVFNFSWTAPAAGTGNVTFYFAGAATNANGSESGDYIYTGSQVFTESTCQTPSQPGVITGTTSLCSGTSNTYSVAAVAGATSYTWSLPSGWTGSSTSASITATSGNGSGNITVTANNSCGPSPVSSLAVSVSAINATPVITNVSCFGGNNGSASVTPSGGTPPYTYAWSPSGGTSPTASNLSAGNYSVTISDANGCRNTVSASVSQPNALTGNSSTTSVLCFGGSDGTAAVASSGGTSPYNYQWTPAGGTAASATNLPAGNYTVTITDSKGCTLAVAAMVSQPTAINATATSTPATCQGSSTGSASVIASGGTGLLQYNWSPAGGTGPTAGNLPAGNYTVLVTDANGCTKNTMVTVTEPPAIVTSFTGTDASCGLPSGTATVHASGGTGGFSYSWSTFPVQTDSTAINLLPGNYSVTVTDANACSRTDSFQVNQLSTLSASSASSAVSCHGGSNGFAVAVATGGSPGYTYNWSTVPVQTNDTAFNLPAGNYTVVVTDQTGCSFTLAVPVTEPAILLASAGPDQVLCAGDSATLGDSLAASGGVASYTYSWMPANDLASPFNPQTNASPPSSALYTLTVTDANGCTASSSVNVTVNPLPLPLISLSNDTLVTALSASYQWYINGNSIPGAIDSYYYPQQNGDYTVYVTDPNGCSDTSAIYTVSFVGIYSLPPAIRFEVHPNPARNSISVNLPASFNNTKLFLLNLHGQIVLEIPAGKRTDIDLSALAEGYYTVLADNGKEKGIARIFISKR